MEIKLPKFKKNKKKQNTSVPLGMKDEKTFFCRTSLSRNTFTVCCTDNAQVLLKFQICNDNWLLFTVAYKLSNIHMDVEVSQIA